MVPHGTPGPATSRGIRREVMEWRSCPARVFVTGLAGLLGAEVARLALGAGRAVHGTVLERPCPVAGVRAARVDVRDAAAVREALVAAPARRGRAHGLPPARGRRARDDRRRQRRRGAGEPGGRARGSCTSRPTWCSPGGLGRPLTEDDLPDPVGAYGAAKAAAEDAVAAADPGAVVVRTSLLHGGPEPGPQERLALEPYATFFTDELRCPTHVADLAAAVLELGDRDELSGPLHVAGADGVDRLAFARALAAAAGRDPAELRGGPGGPSARRTAGWTAAGRAPCCARPSGASRPSGPRGRTRAPETGRPTTTRGPADRRAPRRQLTALAWAPPTSSRPCRACRRRPPPPSFSGISATIASVVRMFLAIDAAFCSAERVTIAGSMTPAATRSTISPVAAFRPWPFLALRTSLTTTEPSRPALSAI